MGSTFGSSSLSSSLSSNKHYSKISSLSRKTICINFGFKVKPKDPRESENQAAINLTLEKGPIFVSESNFTLSHEKNFVCSLSLVKEREFHL